MAWARWARWSSAFHRTMIQVASDMVSSTRATVRVTASPWVQTWARPVEVREVSMSGEVQ
ncbi:hypothetical protein D3C87_1879930 [compost metagenome]